jgi:hypothetical protein
MDYATRTIVVAGALFQAAIAAGFRHGAWRVDRGLYCLLRGSELEERRGKRKVLAKFEPS